MNEKEWEEKQGYCVGIDKLKFFLIPFVCFNALGFPGNYGGFVQILSGFAAPCFFVLCGFLVLSRDVERRKGKLCRAAKRSGLLFLLMLLLYFGANVIYCSSYGYDASWLAMILKKKPLINFFILNEWPMPMGYTIWFIQALFYAYVFLLLINKWLDKVFVRRGLLVICIVIMLITGEFAGMIRMLFVTMGTQPVGEVSANNMQALGVFNMLLMGKVYLPGGMITRALPYLLIGGWLREKSEKLFYIPPVCFPILAAICIVASFFEFWYVSEGGFLVDRSHNIFMGLTAIMLACWAIITPEATLDYAARHGRGYSKWIYAMFQLVVIAVVIIALRLFPKSYSEFFEYIGLMVYGFCLAVAVAISEMKKMVGAIKGDAPELTGKMEGMEELGDIEGLEMIERSESTEGLEEGENLEEWEDIGD